MWFLLFFVFNFILLTRFQNWFSFMINAFIMFLYVSFCNKSFAKIREIIVLWVFFYNITMAFRIFMFRFICKMTRFLANITIEDFTIMWMASIIPYLTFIPSNFLSCFNHVFSWMWTFPRCFRENSKLQSLHWISHNWLVLYICFWKIICCC